MKTIMLSGFAIMNTCILFSQHHVDLSLSNGISRISSVNSNEEEAMSRAKITDGQNWSFNAGAHYNYTFQKWNLETGLTYSLIQGNTTEQFHVYTQIQGVDYDYELNTKREIHYLKIPVTLNYRFDQLELGVGVYGAYRLTNSSWIKGYINSDPAIFQGGGNNVRKFDAGVSCQLKYKLDAKYDFCIAANAGLIDISNGLEKGAPNFFFGFEAHQRTLKTRQLTIGLIYHLF